MIAISYRREDSLPFAGRLYDRLQSEFGRNNVFMDFDSIPYGVDFREHIKQIIGQSKVLVAIIGPNWLGRRKHRGRRIDDPSDFVRLEIAYALERKLPIIPILVSNTQMPRSEELPTDIEALAFRNGLSLDVGIDFHHHAERLSAAINRLLTTSAEPKAAEPEKPLPQIAVPAKIPVTPQPAPITQTPAVAEAKIAPVDAKHDALQQEEKAKTPAIAPPPQLQDRQPRRFIDLDAQFSASSSTFRKLRQAFGNAFSVVKSGTSRLFKSVGNGIRGLLRSVGDLLRRRRDASAFSAIVVVALAIAGSAVFWGIRSGTFEHLVVQAKQFFKERNVAKIPPAPSLPGVVPRPSENLTASIAPGTP